MSKKTAKRIRRTILLALPAAFLVCALYNGLIVNKYELASAKVAQPVRLLLITDLHSHIYGHNQADLIDLVAKQSPDLIFLVGDVVDDRIPWTGAELFFAGIQNLCPIYYVTGNHEYWASDTAGIKEMIRSFGITILSDKYEELVINGTSLIIAGIDDPAKQTHENPNYQQLPSMQYAFTPLFDREGYKILLAHRPERIGAYTKFPFDLILSGHTHGGMVRIPFISNGLHAPTQGWFPQYVGGLYEYEDATMIISRGISMQKPPRVFNPPEIVVIDLVPAP